MLTGQGQYDKLAMTRMATGTDTTILQFITAPNNSFGLTTVDWINECTAVSAFSDSDIAIFYQRDAAVLQQRIPLERVLVPMQARNLEFVVPVRARNGGVVVRYQLAILVLTDV